MSKFYKLDQDLTARRDLSAFDKVLYAVLVDHIGRNRDGWPGVRRLAKCTGTKSHDTVENGLLALERAGLVVIDRRGKGKLNHYRLSAPPDGTVSPPQSAPAGGTPRRHKRTTRRYTGVPAGGTEAHRLAVQNQTDPLNQTKESRRKAPPDPRVREFIDWFAAEYHRALGRTYIVTGGKDGATAKRLLKSLSLDQMKQATASMLSDQWGRQKASIGLLASQINAWLNSPAQTTDDVQAQIARLRSVQE